MELRVARIGKPHGLRGEVKLNVFTDQPQERFVPGASFTINGGTNLRIETVRRHNEAWLVSFSGHQDRTSVEPLVGTELNVKVSSSQEDDAWYPHELIGAQVYLTDGQLIGKVIDLKHYPAQDLLEIKETNGSRFQLPFVMQLVPVVEAAKQRIVITPPGGLLSTDSKNEIVVTPGEPNED